MSIMDMDRHTSWIRTDTHHEYGQTHNTLGTTGCRAPDVGWWAPPVRSSPMGAAPEQTSQDALE
jgi:hypothetical protein